MDEALRQRFKPKNVRGRTWNGEAVFPVSYPEDSEPSSSTSRAGIPQSTDEPPNNSMYMLHHCMISPSNTPCPTLADYPSKICRKEARRLRSVGRTRLSDRAMPLNTPVQ